jgi:hypothetical protein
MRGSVRVRIPALEARTLAKRAPGICEVEPIARPRLYKIAHFDISRPIRPEFILQAGLPAETDHAMPNIRLIWRQ